VTASAADKPEYLASYDPAKGFKPAQRDLTEIFLQIAGSLEAKGSPEPYLRHIASEHARIEALYREKFGKEPRNTRPSFLTDAYVERFAKNWKALASEIALVPWAKEFGKDMRDAILGTRGTGTIIVKILNNQQQKIFDALAGKGGSADFESLRMELVRALELDKKYVNEERYEMARRDAVSFALGIQGMTLKLFKKIDADFEAEDASRTKRILVGMILETAQLAQSELQAGVSEWALAKMSSARK
jgi:hypothetical protein